jgi:hypothetical protein
MSHRSLVAAMLAMPFVALIACSSDSNSGTPAGGKGTFTSSCTSTGQPCTADQTAYEQCLINKCDADYAACFGAGYKSGAFGGPCGPYVQCVLACPCDSNHATCEQNCFPKATSECMTCGQTVDTCENNSGCVDPCAGSGGGGQGGSGQGGSGQGGTGLGGTGGTGTTVTCAQLKDCCAKLPAGQAQTGCLALANAGNEANCAQAGALCSQ